MQELTSYHCFPSCLGRSARVDVTPVAKAFDKVSLMAHLVKEEGSQDPNPTTPRAGRPTPVFTDVKDEAEELSGTIPWAVPVKPSPDRSVDGKVAAKASHHHHRVEVAHHHHHLHLQPAPSAHHHTHHISCLASPPPQMIFADDCSRFAPDERHCPQPSAGIRAEVCHGGQTAASPAPVNRQREDILEEDLRLSSSEEEEEKFTSGMRRLITRAELHRLHELHRRHHL